MGCLHIGVATPWDDCPYGKSNDNTFVRARAYSVFLTSCVWINLRDIPRGLRHPQDVPLVDPSTLSRKTLYELASLKYCYIAKFLSLHRIATSPLFFTLFVSSGGTSIFRRVTFHVINVPRRRLEARRSWIWVNSCYQCCLTYSCLTYVLVRVAARQLSLNTGNIDKRTRFATCISIHVFVIVHT